MAINWTEAQIEEVVASILKNLVNETPAAIIPILLQITVSEGLVLGVMLPTTPKGAISVKVSP